MVRLPGSPGDYVWLAIGVAMIVAGFMPTASSDLETTTGGPAQAQDDAPSSDLFPTPPTTPPPKPGRDLPDLPVSSLSPANGTTA
ncbi:MAG: hypothetical protein KY455_09990 [Euryarchaeota archaeon]|nr:hypothetical protein [Euryarchaeota archaeon]